MAFDFPSSPSAGQEFTPAGGPTYVWQSPRWLPKGVIPGVTISDTPPTAPVQGQLWLESDSGNLFAWWNDGDSTAWVQVSGSVAPVGTAEARNRIVNGAMQISQENGNTAGSSVLSYWAADQWTTSITVTINVTSQRVQVVTPNGSRDRYRAAIGVANASLGAGDFVFLWQAIEGIRSADFGWGTASAKQVVVRFGFKGPAGTYSCAISNNTVTRSYVANFTITAGQANTDTVQTFVIPGDTTGIWPTDTSMGMLLTIAMAVGTTYRGVAGWQAGYVFGTAANTNGAGTVGNTFELFDVGLYLDPLATGMSPAWQMPDEAQELAACQRYYEMTRMLAYNAGNVMTGYFVVSKRTTPTMAMGLIDSGSGVAVAALGPNSFYQGVANSVVTGAVVIANARM